VVVAAVDSAAAAVAAADMVAGAAAGLAHVELPTLQLAAVQLGDGLLRLAGRTHLDEPEAARPARRAIGDDGRGLAGPGFGEQRLQILARRVERQIANEQLLAHELLPPRREAFTLFGRLPGREAAAVTATGRDHAQTIDVAAVAPTL